MKTARMAVLALAVVGTTLSVIPASATHATCVIDPLSFATVANQDYPGKGLYYPGAGAPDGALGPNIETAGPGAAIEPAVTQDHFTWTVNLDCLNGGSAAASGEGDGWCGHSTGSGTGTYTDSAGNEEDISIDWISAGSQLVLTPSASDSVTGSVNAFPDPTVAGNSCAQAGGGVRFLLHGVVTGLA